MDTHTTIFTGAGVAIITPMNSDGSINYSKLGEIIEEQIAGGTDSVVICGTTGESATMTDDEHRECIRFAVEKVAKRVPVIAGTGSNDTAYAIELSKEAEKLGADALLIVTPYYNKTSQRGLIAHFTAIADAVNVPIILYNVPSRTGVCISIDTYVELSKHRNIIGVKEASSDFGLIAKIAAHTDLDIYSGCDDETAAMMALGAKGVISVLSNIAPKETHDLAAAALNGDFAGCRALQLKYLDVINKLFSDVNPIPVKEAMNLMGKNVGECRLPLLKMEQAKIDALSAAMKNVGLL